MSNKQVYKYMRIAPSRDELLVKKLRWYQQIARSPELQSVWFACMFGTFGFEHHHTSEHDGSFHRDAHPRVQQFQNDILEQLLRFEDGAVLVSFLDNRPLRIFTDLRQPFIKLDVSAIRLKHFAVCIPPPEYVASPEVSATEEGGEADLEEPSFRCTCLCEDGTPCRATFKSKQQLSVHVRSTQGGTHAVIPDYRKLAIQTNALVAGMCSVAGALRNNTLGELCAISNSLAVVVLWCSSQKFPVITFAHIARLHLQRCHNCGTTWSNMLLGPGAKSSCSEPHSLQPVCFTIDAWELGPPAARPMAKRVLWGPKRTWQRPCISSPGCASRTLEVRELPAACFVTFILPKACPYVQAVLDATKQYADKAKSAQSGKCEAPPGEPHVHAWAALLRVALDDAALNAEDRQAIEQHRAVSTDALVMSGIVYVCKTAKPLTGTA